MFLSNSIYIRRRIDELPRIERVMRHAGGQTVGPGIVLGEMPRHDVLTVGVERNRLVMRSSREADACVGSWEQIPYPHRHHQEEAPHQKTYAAILPGARTAKIPSAQQHSGNLPDPLSRNQRILRRRLL